jgi:RNA polymerase-binding transcription factor DksA
MATAKKATANKIAPAAKTATKSASAKAAPAQKAAPVATKSAPAKVAATKSAPASAGSAPAKKAATGTKKAAGAEAVATPAAPTKQPVAKKAEPKPAAVESPIPAVKGVTKDGIAYTKDFDAKFLTSIHALLLDERAQLAGQATLLEDEANALIAEHEMGDVQFDEEGGQGDTMVVERERDLALSGQARQTIAEIDAALERLTIGTYGYSVVSGRPIPRERLEAIPWAEVLVEEKVGGIGRR